MTTTTLKVSKDTLSKLEKLKRKSGARNLEQVILVLMQENRKSVLESILGIDKGRLTPFVEEDRGEDRS